MVSVGVISLADHRVLIGPLGLTSKAGTTRAGTGPRAGDFQLSGVVTTLCLWFLWSEGYLELFRVSARFVWC